MAELKTLKQVNAARAKLEAEMEGEIDSLLQTRSNAARSLGDSPYPMKTHGYGPRTLNCRMGYRRQTVWGIPAKRRAGALG